MAMSNYCNPLEQKPATHKGDDLVHVLESTNHRTNRLGINAHAQPLCGSGNAHAHTTKIHWRVTCPKCKEMLNQYPKACED